LEDPVTDAQPRPADNELARLTAHIAEVGFVLPGTLMERYTRCTSTNCRCRADPPRLHGPYRQWTRKVAGKTVTRRLDQRQYERYKPWFDNARRLRELLQELEALSLRTAEDAEGWEPQT
jgi:hypothetical protein